MSNSARLKSVFKKLGLVLTLLPSFLLILGCVFIFSVDNLLSFGFSLILPILLVLNVIIGVYWLLKKNKFFLLSFFCIILYFLCFDSFYQFNKPESSDFNKASANLGAFSLLSYNTHGFKNDGDDAENIDGQIVKFIKNKNPDIFCIQEFSAIKYKFFNNYPYYFKTNLYAGKGKSVMAIFSKYPIIGKGYIDFPNTTNGGMYVEIAFGERNIRIYNLHLESYKKDIIHELNIPEIYSSIIKRINSSEKSRIEQAKIVKNHINKFKGRVVICGDFNSTQFSSTYNVLKASRKDSFIEAGFGLGSTYRVLNYPFRLDYILVDECFEVLSHQNFNIELSDHEPILARFVVN